MLTRRHLLLMLTAVAPVVFIAPEEPWHALTIDSLYPQPPDKIEKFALWLQSKGLEVLNLCGQQHFIERTASGNVTKNILMYVRPKKG